MIKDLINIFFISATTSFIDVGVFVAITLLIFGVFNHLSGGTLTEKITESKKLQVIIGAILGLVPGCGITIMLMPLYLMRKITFGTVMASLIATMSDAAFVVLVAAPKAFTFVSIICFFTAIIVGYTIDYFSIGKNFVKPESSSNSTNTDLENNNNNLLIQKEDLIASCGACCNKNKNKNKNDYTFTSRSQKCFYNIRYGVGYKLFLVLVVVCFPLSIISLLKLDISNSDFFKSVSIIGVLGTLFSLLYTFLNKKMVDNEVHSNLKCKSNYLKDVFIKNSEEAAFVVVWVFLALLSYDILLYFIGGDEVLKSLMLQNGYITIIVAVIVGLIPGCGPQIVLATLYVSGATPLSALVANAISNDGDALFPLIALNKKSAIYATIYGLIPAFIVGSILYMMGF